MRFILHPPIENQLICIFPHIIANWFIRFFSLGYFLSFSLQVLYMNESKRQKIVLLLTFIWQLTRPRGIEPPTHGTGNRCSIRLSYGRKWYTKVIIPVPFSIDKFFFPLLKRNSLFLSIYKLYFLVCMEYFSCPNSLKVKRSGNSKKKVKMEDVSFDLYWPIMYDIIRFIRYGTFTY